MKSFKRILYVPCKLSFIIQPIGECVNSVTYSENNVTFAFFKIAIFVNGRRILIIYKNLAMKHIKVVLLSAIAFFSGLFLYGQAKEASVMIDNQNRSAVMISITQPDQITADALQQRMERSGLKDKGKNNVWTYKGVTLSEISPDKVDIYTKVEKGPNNTSVVYMAVSRGYNNFTSGATDSLITENVKTFLQSLVKDADLRYADVGISNQINDVNKDQKAYQKLLDEQGDLQKKKTKLDNRLTEIQNELVTRQDAMTKKKADMEDAKARRAAMGAQ